jgi:hypothetical protein
MRLMPRLIQSAVRLSLNITEISALESKWPDKYAELNLIFLKST